MVRTWRTRSIAPTSPCIYRARSAVGRSILVIIWHLLADPQARFTDVGPDWHARNSDRDRKIRAHLRGLQALGLNVEISSAAA